MQAEIDLLTFYFNGVLSKQFITLSEWVKISLSSLLTSIAYCLHFVDVVIVNNVIEGGVELVEEVHNLVGSAGARQLSKADNITVTGE